MCHKSSPIAPQRCEFDILCRQWKSVSLTLKNGIHLYYDHVCQYCDQNDSDLEVDHIVSKKDGGQTCLCNLILACKRCNHRKRRDPLTLEQEQQAKALARQAVPELVRYLQEPAALRQREHERLRPQESASERNASECLMKAVLERMLRPSSGDAVCKKRRRPWGTLLSVVRQGKPRRWLDGIFVIEGARCSWPDPNLVVVIKVDLSKGQTRNFELPEAYTFDRSQPGSLAPYRGLMPEYVSAWLGQNGEDLIEDFTIFYDGRHKLPSFPFRRQQELPRPRWAVRG